MMLIIPPCESQSVTRETKERGRKPRGEIEMTTVTVRAEKKTHIADCNGRIVRQDDGGKTGLKSGEQYRDVDGFLAIESSQVFSWHATKAGAMDAAKKMKIHRELANATFGHSGKTVEIVER
jgi:hypothetical protein